MLVELLIYFVEIFLAVRSKDNKQLREANIAGECEFLDLQEGYRTGLSYFRTSMFIAYVIAVIMFIDTSQGKQTLDEILLFIVFGILIYMVTLMNQRIFIFHTSYFIIGAPFHFFKRDAIIRYEEIEDFRLYRALYSSYFLRIRFKNGTEKLYQFSGSFLPRNDLVLKITLNSVTGLNKDFRKLRRKSIRTDFIDDDEN
jgi:hypothetical protein